MNIMRERIYINIIHIEKEKYIEKLYIFEMNKKYI